VHLAHFLVSPLLGGLAIHLHNGIPFIDAWFSSCAAMTGGSLMPYDVSKLDRFGEVVLWILMCVGGVTIMCLPPACNRMYIFRTKLRPLIKCVGDARARARWRCRRMRARVHPRVALTRALCDAQRGHHAHRGGARAGAGGGRGRHGEAGGGH
jgi:hypothetical protein